MSEELKRCGCGGEARVLHRIEHGYYVRCRDCFTRTDYKVTEAKAIEAWNKAMGKRTAKVESLVLTSYPSQTVWKCGECGKLLLGQVNYCPICGARLEWE